MWSCTRKTKRAILLIGCVVSSVLAGCSNLGVDLNTDEPIKVDIAVKLDVYQHQAEERAPSSTANAAAVSVEERRRRRMGEIQTLKNNRIVGENHLGLLEIRTEPPGEFGEYAKRIVTEENEDRIKLMNQLASNESVPMTTIQERQANLFYERAFAGEWIETRNPGGGYVWEQKRNQ